MKIAISSNGKTLNDNIAEVFGRCSYFIMVEIENDKIAIREIIKNESINQTSGAGMMAAKLVVEKGAKVVIAKNVGPRALDVLRQFNVDVFMGEGTAEESLHKFINKK
jgi:predicted Fe-Mo cluster-binding NifX family protein